MAFALMLASARAHAAGAPEWVQRTPAADKAFVYAVGDGQSTTLPEAEKAALADALGKLAAQAGVTVAARTIATESTRESDSNIFVETKSSARGTVRDAESVGRPFVETSRHGLWPFRPKRSYAVKVLLRWPRASFDRERQRQASIWKDYRDALDRLAQGIVTSINKSELPRAVTVDGFMEATTQRPYTFSQILKRDLSDSLVRAGLVVVSAQKAITTVGGAYRIAGTEVIVTARIGRLDTSEGVGVVEVALDRGMIEPSWLENSSPVEPFFESLEPERADARTRVGAISVTSKLDGAQVFVDGVPRGRTPTAFGGIPVGERSIMVLAVGREPFIKRVRVLEGETLAVEAALLPKRGDLEVRSIPAGAEVLHQGQRIGITPLRLKGLPVGRYDFTLLLDGHGDGKVVAEVLSKNRVVSEVLLSEKPGSILVVSDPPGATIFLDGVKVGKALAPKGLKLDHVSAGPHQVSATKTGDGVWGGAVTVHALKTEPVNAVLKDNMGMLSLSVYPMMDSIQLSGKSDSISILSGDSTCEPNFPCNLRIPLKEGEYRVEIIASGYESETRTIYLKPGRETKLSLKLTIGDSSIKNGAASHLFGKLMPVIKGAVVDNWKDHNPVVNVLATCIVSPVLALGLAVDAVALPFRIVALPLHSGPTQKTYFAKVSEKSVIKMRPLDRATPTIALSPETAVNMSIEDFRLYLDRGKSQ